MLVTDRRVIITGRNPFTRGGAILSYFMMRGSKIIMFRGKHGLRLVVLFVVVLLMLIWVWNSAMQQGGQKGEETKGLTTWSRNFFIDGKKMKIFSGAMHYFRVMPTFWKDRMLKMKAAGLNTLETYVPWNLHEEIRGELNFEDMLDIRSYIKLAQELGLYVIVRPGPYICAEMDFGGLPSWLLHDPNMKVRSTYGPYLHAVDAYFAKLFAQITDLQYQNGGPIIAFQIENEYGGYGEEVAYLSWLRHTLQKHGVKELLFTSDNRSGLKSGSLPAVLMTGNFKGIDGGSEIFNYLLDKQPTEPLMVMEYWSGWFDHWGEAHNKQTTADFRNTLRFILDADASVNFYMFHGGTNFGFTNGANDEPYAPTITSYDYDAPLSESGDVTTKFTVIRNMLPKYMIRKKEVPDPPPSMPSFAYGMVMFDQMLDLDDLLSILKPMPYPDVLPMEMLDINNGGGQGYGFILYRKKGMAIFTDLKIIGAVRDRALILVNGVETHTVDWSVVNKTMSVQDSDIDWKADNVLDILVENLGRVNYAGFGSNVLNEQRKGLKSKSVMVDGSLISHWDIYPLQFKEKFIKRAGESRHWLPVPQSEESLPTQPALYKGYFNIAGKPKDTFLDTKGWTKGVVFVNGFNIGRYWSKGPQRTLYIPAPLLRSEKNQIMIFELHKPHSSVTLLNKSILQ